MLAMNSHNMTDQLLIPWARVGSIPGSVQQGCAQENLWDWLEAQTECFDRITVPSSPSDPQLGPEWGFESVPVRAIDVKLV